MPEQQDITPHGGTHDGGAASADSSPHGHGRSARSWNAVDRFIRALRTRQALPFIAAGDRVLDVGSGRDAHFLRALGGLDVEYVGVDPEAEDALPAPRATIMRASFDGRLPFGDGSFTKIVSLASLEHLDDPASLLRESRRLLGRGGMLILTTPTPAAKPVLVALAAFGIVNKEEIAEHRRYFGRDELVGLCRAAGFSRVEHRHFELGFNQLVICGA